MWNKQIVCWRIIKKSQEQPEILLNLSSAKTKISANLYFKWADEPHKNQAAFILLLLLLWMGNSNRLFHDKSA